MNNPDENVKIVKGCISVVLQDRDLKFWERSEKNNWRASEASETLLVVVLENAIRIYICMYIREKKHLKM